MNRNVALMALTGILTLASCGQNGTGTPPDTTKPNVTLSTSTGNVASAGGQVILTGTVNEAVTASSVRILGNNGQPACTPTVSGQSFSCTVTLPANSTTAGVINTYTAYATDTAGNEGVSNQVTVTVAAPTNPGGGGGNPGETSAPVINITSPVQGSNLTNETTVTVTGSVTSALPLTSLKVNDVVIPVNAGLNNEFSVALPIGNMANGPFNIIVTATDANGKTSSLTRSVTVNRPQQTTATVSVGPDLGANGREAARNMVGGSRQIAQSNPDASGPVSDVFTYVKGIVDVTATAPAGSSRLEVYVAATPDGPAIDNLIDTANPTGPVTVKYDTRRRGNLEAQPLFLISRVNNTQVSFTRIVADNTAPDPADVRFEGSNIRENFGPNGLNYARGSIRLLTTNTDLRDKPNGVSNGVALRPSGFDSVSYYFVPAPYERTSAGITPRRTDITNAIDNASTMGQKLGAVKTNARTSQDVTASGNNDDFGATFNSGAAPLTDGAYRIYSVTRDQLGNEALNPQYVTIIFDNAAPNLQGTVIRDDSPLPFPSANPTKYISDFFVVGNSVNADPDLPDGTPGIGFDQNSQITVGSLNITPGQRYDSNRLADGTYTVNTSQLSDILGNTQPQGNGQVVIIDNSDPTINFNGPDNGTTFTSGDEVTSQTTVSDRFSGVYRTFMFWNDYTDAGAARNRGTGFVSAPVEFFNNQVFAAGQDTGNTEVRGPLSNSAKWNAVYPYNTNVGPQMMWLQGMAIDNAGNASIIRREIMVRPKSAAYTAPTLGQFDVFRRDMNGAFASTPLVNPGSLALRGQDSTLSRFGIETTDLYDVRIDPEVDARIALRVSGSNPSVANSNGGERIRDVDMYGQFNSALWNRIVAYQTGTGRDVDPTLSFNNGLAASRGFQWTNINQNGTGPWLKLGNTATSSEFYTADTSVNSFLTDYIKLDNVVTNPTARSSAAVAGPQATGTARPFYDTRNRNQLPYFKYDAIAGIVTDTAGFRSGFGEVVATPTVERPGAPGTVVDLTP